METPEKNSAGVQNSLFAALGAVCAVILSIGFFGLDAKTDALGDPPTSRSPASVSHACPASRLPAASASSSKADDFDPRIYLYQI